MWNRICEMMDWNRAGLLTGAAFTAFLLRHSSTQSPT